MNDLRATTWIDFTGQDQIVKSLKIALSAAKDRLTPVEHILFYGPPGLGKTSLAHIIANEQKSSLKIVSGPSLTRVGDLASILTSLETGDILFIDEIHRLPKAVEESLYSAMEDFGLDMILGKGPSARTIRLELNPFTVIGATTKIGLLSKPLRDRFGHTHHLKLYEPLHLSQIVTKAAKKLKLEIDNQSTLEISKRSRGTPRIALKLLRRVIDYCHVEHQAKPSLPLTLKALDFYQVDEYGLDELDRRLLTLIITQYHGGPVGLETIAALISEDIKTIEDVHEPFLLQIGFLDKTPRGRQVTPKAYQHLKIPQTKQK
jgi:holliday junction DNA helicase RuvB